MKQNDETETGSILQRILLNKFTKDFIRLVWALQREGVSTLFNHLELHPFDDITEHMPSRYV